MRRQRCACAQKAAFRFTQNDFRCAVMARRYHCGVMLMLVRGVPKVNHFHIWVLHRSLISLL